MGIAQAGQSEQIDQDIPCMSCGYNLRGLRREGKCPECGTLISPSIEAYQLLEAKRAWSIADSDHGWLRSIAEGMTIISVALFLILLMSFAPEWAYTLNSPQRRVMRGLGCTIWVLCWYGICKLTAREPNRGSVDNKQGQYLRFTLRACATVYATFPFIDFSAFSETANSTITISILIAGLIGSGCYYAFLSTIARRADVNGAEATAMVLTAINPIIFFFSLTNTSFDYDGLSKITVTPTTPFGPAIPMLDAIFFWWSKLGSYGLEAFTFLVAIGMTLLISESLAHIALCIRLWRVVKGLETENARLKMERMASSEVRGEEP